MTTRTHLLPDPRPNVAPHTLTQRLDESDAAFSGRCDAAKFWLDAATINETRFAIWPILSGDGALRCLARARRAVLGGSPNL